LSTALYNQANFCLKMNSYLLSVELAILIDTLDAKLPLYLIYVGA